jgi:protein-ribulosamine 3-kinase
VLPDELIREAIRSQLGSDLQLQGASIASGGMINQAATLQSNKGTLFIKWNNDSNCPDLFEKEAHGLRLLKKSPIKSPEVLGLGTVHHTYFLILSHIRSGPPKAKFWERFGQELAKQHLITHESYGLDHDNHIGKLPQHNSPSTDWSNFFIYQRLMPQLTLARNSGLIETSTLLDFESLFKKLPDFFPNEPPSMIHGDLWSGNFMSDENGAPVIFDPAAHYANREVELAFTKLFGGFDSMFYTAYFDTYPVDRGFEERVDMYNLYPLLVHLNLFGSSYLASVRQALKSYL